MPFLYLFAISPVFRSLLSLKQLPARLLQTPHGTGVEKLQALPDGSIEFGQTVKGALAQHRQYPALGK